MHVDNALTRRCISYDLYQKRLRQTPLEKANTYIRGIGKNSHTQVEGRITLRVTIGHRKVKLPFLVIKEVTNDMLRLSYAMRARD